MYIINEITIPSVTNIEYIFHISDIHTRNNKRHKEYNEVFDNLYNELANAPKNSIAYLAGDLVHTKTQISPELVEMTINFIKAVTELMPTIVITGNHDCNLQNKSRLDSLQPIIDAIHFDKTLNNRLFYLKNTGIYRVNNQIDFIVYGVTDNYTQYNELKTYYDSLDTSKYKSIILYHGTVHGARTDSGYTLTNDKINSSLFSDVDFSMLGDIHGYQIVK